VNEYGEPWEQGERTADLAGSHATILVNGRPAIECRSGSDSLAPHLLSGHELADRINACVNACAGIPTDKLVGSELRRKANQRAKYKAATEAASDNAPQFTHDSECCVFLGRWYGPETSNERFTKKLNYDLYWCRQGTEVSREFPVVIARYGSDGHEYNCGAFTSGHNLFIPALIEADKRAESKGLCARSP
jgi:hypothetical protein